MFKKKKDNNIEQDYDDINPYKSDKFSKIPSWILIFILKCWAAGAAVFFIGMGGTEIGLNYANIDLSDPNAAFQAADVFLTLLILCVALFMNYICKPIINFMHNSRNNTYRFNMVNKKGFIAFILNLGYAALCLIPIYFITVFIAQKDILPNLFGAEYGWGLDPFTMAFLYGIIDGIYLLIRYLIVILYKKIKYAKLNKA